MAWTMFLGSATPLPGDIVGRAMIDRGTNDGQAHRDIHPQFKFSHLERDVPLVMIHGHDPIEVAAFGAGENRIWGNGAADVPPTCPRLLYRWADLMNLFIAEQPMLAGMGIEPRHRQTWLRHAHGAGFRDRPAQ